MIVEDPVSIEIEVSDIPSHVEPSLLTVTGPVAAKDADSGEHSLVATSPQTSGRRTRKKSHLKSSPNKSGEPAGVLIEAQSTSASAVGEVPASSEKKHVKPARSKQLKSGKSKF